MSITGGYLVETCRNSDCFCYCCYQTMSPSSVRVNIYRGVGELSIAHSERTTDSRISNRAQLSGY